MPRNKDKVVKYFRFEGKSYSVSADNEIDAEIKKREKLKQLETGSLIYASNMTLNKWAKICIDTYKIGVTEKYLSSYKSRTKNTVLDVLGNMQLKNIKNIHCQNCIKAQEGKSAYQIKQTNQILNFLLEKAVTNHLIESNPAAKLNLPKGTMTKRRSITAFERKHFLSCARANPNYYVFLASYYCGCRPSEALELRGTDIVVTDGRPLFNIRGTKSEAANRTVPIPLDFYNLIKDLPRIGYLFPTSSGKKIPEKNYRGRWSSLINAMNISAGCKTYRNQVIPPYIIEPGFVPYYLRHTYCTDLRDKGVDIRVAQYLMGHSDIRLTANIYTHDNKDMILEAARKIEENII